ncbi:MAG TPA: ArsI/CadI family heavy metal resistance metalloenzyme [Pyrinomonadaceae bacterium]|nr:ArsI/CadI family heavy metal resistance metalloenzyme [Pyrinomonadaceae bacterium]
MESKTTAGVATLKAHLALYVSDVEKSMEFYRGMLGIEPAKVRPGYAKFDVERPPLNLTLNENAGRAGRGAVSHLGIQVASTGDVLELRERWRAAGLPTFDEMGTNCCYALQDKTWVRDPDGYEWEAFVVLEDNLAETALCCVPEAEAASGETGEGASTSSPAMLPTASPATSPAAPTAAPASSDASASPASAASCATPAADAATVGCCGATAPATITR